LADHLAAHAGGDRAQLALLVGRGLVDGGNAKVENRSAHDLALRFDDRPILLIVRAAFFEGFFRTAVNL